MRHDDSGWSQVVRFVTYFGLLALGLLAIWLLSSDVVIQEPTGPSLPQPTNTTTIQEDVYGGTEPR